MIHPVYNPIIREACSIDADTAAVVEALIRVETPTLDHLTRAQLARLARASHADYLWAETNDPELIAFYRAEAGVA